MWWWWWWRRAWAVAEPVSNPMHTLVWDSNPSDELRHNGEEWLADGNCTVVVHQGSNKFDCLTSGSNKFDCLTSGSDKFDCLTSQFSQRCQSPPLTLTATIYTTIFCSLKL